MYYDIVNVKHIADYKLELTFEDKAKGIVDFRKYLQRGGVFQRFSDPDYFRKAYIHKELAVLCWPDNLDIAPETLYSQATGHPLPTWMTPEKDENEITPQQAV